ncbi:TetR/AcrR family transcriptional regulator (plasmid) [Rhizobium ruizarguesonis]|nr:TetR/AcrR family transcriptional regulator [Rhizobium ruizarguesonis]TAT96080.1 TetR/AcrR family transcriptional regulator [Rhizobium ruizarguesonis]
MSIRPVPPRQANVLEHALFLLASGGKKSLTSARLAKAARCSKESIYKWFGNREQLLTAMVSYQTAKVRFESDGKRLTPVSLYDHLLVFAQDLLRVLAEDTWLSLTIFAITQKNQGKATLAKLVLESGSDVVECRGKLLIEAGQRAGLLRLDEIDEAYQALYGLVVSDIHVRMLLGGPAPRDIARRAERAVRSFIYLHAPDNNPLEAIDLVGSVARNQPAYRESNRNPM